MGKPMLAAQFVSSLIFQAGMSRGQKPTGGGMLFGCEKGARDGCGGVLHTCRGGVGSVDPRLQFSNLSALF